MLVVAIAVGALTTALRPDETRLSGACGVIVDGSGSAKGEKNLRATDLINDYLPSFLRRSGCKTVTYAPITAASSSSPCKVRAKDVNIDPDADGPADRKQLWADRRQTAVKQAQSVLECASQDWKGSTTGSDVIGGLTVSMNKRPKGASTYRLFVVSDFVHRVRDDFSIYPKTIATPEQRRAAVKTLTNSPPNLDGVSVYAVGFGNGYSSDTTAANNLSSFWEEYMTAKNARWNSNYTGGEVD